MFRFGVRLTGWGFIKWNPHWEITQQVTRFDPAKANPGPSFYSIISISHPSVSFSSLHPAALPCPPPSPCGGLTNETGVSWLGALRHWLQCLGCLVCTVANPLILFSDPLPALPVKLEEVREFRSPTAASSIISPTARGFSAINRQFTPTGEWAQIRPKTKQNKTKKAKTFSAT